MDKEQLIRRVVDFGLHQLGDTHSYSSHLVPCVLDNHLQGEYFLLISRPEEDLLLFQEIVKGRNSVTQTYRTWSFRKRTYWEVVSVDFMGRQIFLDGLAEELADFDRKLDHLVRIGSPKGLYFDDEMSETVLSLAVPDRHFSLRTLIDNQRVRFLGYLSLAAGFVLLLSLTSYTAFRFRGIVDVRNDIDHKLAILEKQSERKFEEINSFINTADSDLRSLKENLLQNERDLEFNKRQARINVLRLAEELTYYLPSRKEAYQLVADNISEAVSYGEIIYEMSRLPSEEYQARVFLATAREKIMPFSRFEPVFASMSYPVQQPGMPNDGQGFRITSTYLEKRQNPFGTGGSSPHFAIDISNVANISVVNYAGEIKRDGNEPGNVVSIAPGYVRYNGQDDGYGWAVEVEHDMVPEVLKAYPDARGWRSFYAHLAVRSGLVSGTRVEKEQFLGYIGNTGLSTGPHLHFEVRIYRPKGRYSGSAGRFDKINPYPKERTASLKIPVN